ncbi:MAG: hypothetical protein B6I20_12720 [Bacteroidetes bacterium 4572_117]|nr:MAG: hypothetical protein B6I20_12720 [Bacteroidetes bacterium 4572_117]
MDLFAKALVIADKIMNNSKYLELRKSRYQSFDTGEGALFERNDHTLESLRELALQNGEPKQISGKQELYEMIIARQDFF